MGYFASSVGKYRILYGDYEWNYIKDKKPKSYYENLIISAEIRNNETDEEIDIEIPFLEIANIFLLKKNYSFEYKDDNALLKYLWKWIKANTNYQPEEYVFTYGNLHNKEYQDDKLFTDTYYLQSEIGDDNVILGVIPKKHKINSINDYKWIHYKCLRTRYKE